jgi:ZIP family zinc transporter/zinc and cadmium transporter
VRELVLFNVGAAAMTLFGGLVPAIRGALSRRTVARMFALRSGLLLGIALVGVLPEAARLDEAWSGWGALTAFVALFLVESTGVPDACCEYVEDCHAHLLGPWAFAALALHSFLDGANLSAALAAGAAVGAAGGFALLVHKLADGYTVTSLMLEGGWRRDTTLTALAAVTLATPLGSLVAHAGLAAMPAAGNAALLGFSGGSLLYIGAAGAFTRAHKDKDRWALASFAAGAVFMGLLRSVR